MAIPRNLSNLANGVDTSGTLAVAKGGTGQTTATAAFNALAPSQTGNAGKYLITDGTNTSWAVADALPSQTGNSGKYLYTNGTAASWELIPSFLAVLNRAGSTIQIDTSSGYIPVLNRAGSTINVPVS